MEALCLPYTGRTDRAWLTDLAMGQGNQGKNGAFHFFHRSCEMDKMLVSNKGHGQRRTGHDNKKLRTGPEKDERDQNIASIGLAMLMPQKAQRRRNYFKGKGHMASIGLAMCVMKKGKDDTCER